MPGRTSVRANRISNASVVSKKSSAQSIKSRATSTRSSAYTIDVPDEGPQTSLRERICAIFADAQKGVATQRKLAVTLRKAQELCCYEQPKSSAGKKMVAFDEDFAEEEFNLEVGRVCLRILAVKKSESVGDRLVRFLGLFLKVASDRGRTHLSI